MPPERRFLRALAAFAFALVVAFFVVRGVFAGRTRAVPDREARAWALLALEAGRLGRDVPKPPASARTYEAVRPIRVLAFAKGRVAVASETSRNLASAVLDAVASFRTHGALRTSAYVNDDGHAHTSIAIPLGAAPILVRAPVLDHLQLVATRDGITVRHRGRRATFSPDELFDRDFSDRGYVTPLPEVYAGVPMPRIVEALAEKLGVPAETLLREGRFERLPTLTLTRDVYPKRRAVTAANVRAAIDAATDYLLRSERYGMFEYIVDARGSFGRHDAGYNLPRHAGTAYFLAQSARVTGRADAREASKRALEWVISTYGRACGGALSLCLVEGERADVGAAALTLVAVSELARTDSDGSLRIWATALGTFLLAQQRPDGEMMHEYDFARRTPIDVQYLYYSGESALALLRAHEVTHDARFLEAARKLLVRLSTTAWAFPGSRYVYNEEHWTCIALGESDGRLDLPSLRDFCRRVYLWNDRLQYRHGEGPWDSEGGYGATRFLLPRTPPAATRGEAFVAAFGALARHGDAPEGMRRHVERALSQLLAHQYRPGPTRFFSDPPRLVGGMPGSVVDPDVRIDYTQHAGSAFVRYLDLLERERVSGRRLR